MAMAIAMLPVLVVAMARSNETSLEGGSLRRRLLLILTTKTNHQHLVATMMIGAEDHVEITTTMVDGDEVAVMSSDLLVERGGAGAIIPTRQDHVVILHHQSHEILATLHPRDPIIPPM